MNVIQVALSESLSYSADEITGKFHSRRKRPWKPRDYGEAYLRLKNYFDQTATVVVMVVAIF